MTPPRRNDYIVSLGETVFRRFARQGQAPGTAWVSSYKGVAGQAAEAIAQFGVDNADKVAGARNPAK